jgi:hypothetical protein
MQRYTIYLYLKIAPHVSDGNSTHHQERIQLYLQHLVFVTPLLLSWKSWNWFECDVGGVRTFSGITPVSSVSNGLYFLTLQLVSVMRLINTSKRMSKKFGVRVIHRVRVIYRKIRIITESRILKCWSMKDRDKKLAIVTQQIGSRVRLGLLARSERKWAALCALWTRASLQTNGDRQWRKQ